MPGLLSLGSFPEVCWAGRGEIIALLLGLRDYVQLGGSQGDPCLVTYLPSLGSLLPM